MYCEKEYQKVYHKKWYNENKKQRMAQIHERRDNLRKWLSEYKSKLKCELCPESHISTLEFHHKDQSKKDLEISITISRGWSKERILSEISKCQVLCANCHRKFHWHQFYSPLV